MVYQQLQTQSRQAQPLQTQPLQTKPWQPQQVHCALSQRSVVDANTIVWCPAPSPCVGIWFGCFEADDLVQEHPLTMLTRFEPGGFFPTHGHPGGEEILVIQGSFTDETGDYPVGSYMLNPEGFSHCPVSADGCITFVKLRQHGGHHRQQIKVNINHLPWLPSPVSQIDVKPLYEQVGFSEKVRIERWHPGTRVPMVVEPEVKEIFVLEGIWADDLGEYSANTWLRYPPGYRYTAASPTGCVLYVKTYSSSQARFNCNYFAK